MSMRPFAGMVDRVELGIRGRARGMRNFRNLSQMVCLS